MILRYCRWVDVHTGKNTKHGSEDKTKKNESQSGTCTSGQYFFSVS